MARILIVEDNPDIAGPLREHLCADGHQVQVFADGRSVVEAVRSWDPEIIVLDLMLPDMPGEDILHALRATGVETPVLILSARNDEATKVRGLRSGADDYVTKPFGLMELLARIDNLLLRRRAPPSIPQLVRLGDIEIHSAAREVFLRGQRVDLRPREMDLLLALLQRHNQAVSRAELLGRVWKYQRTIETRTVDWHMGELRRKLGEDPERPRYLHTVKRIGYRLDLPVDARPET